MPPTRTTRADSRTPARNRLPRICSTCSSDQPALPWDILQFPSAEALVDHLDREGQDDHGEDDPQHPGFDDREDPRPYHGPAQHAEHDRHGQPRVNVAGPEVD